MDDEKKLVENALDLVKGQLAVLRQNFCALEDPRNLDIPDSKVNCVSVLSELASVFEELNRNLAACSALDASILQDIKTQSDACLREVHDLATEIVAMKPLTQSAGLEKISLIEATLGWMGEILFGAASVKPSLTPAEPIDPSVQPGPPADATVSASPDTQETAPINPADILNIIETNLKETSPQSEKTAEDTKDQAAADKRISKKTKKPELPKGPLPARDEEGSSSLIHRIVQQLGDDKPEQTTEKVASPGVSESPAGLPVKPTASNGAVPPEQSVLPEPASPSASVPTEQIQKENNATSQEPQTQSTEPTSEPPSTLPEIPAKQRAAEPPSPPIKSVSDEMLQEAARLNKELADRIHDLEKQLHDLSGQEHDDARAIEAKLQSRLEFFEEKLKEVKRELTEEMMKAESAIERKVADLAEKQGEALQMKVEQLEEKLFDTTAAPPLVKARSTVPPSPHADPETIADGVTEPPKPALPLEPHTVYQPPKESFWAFLYRIIKIFLIALVIFNLLFFGILYLLDRWKPSQKFVKPAAPTLTKELTAPTPYYDTWVASRPSGLEKRSLKLLILQLRSNPKPGVRSNMAVMLGKWKWKGVPDILLETLSVERDPDVLKELTVSFKALTGYDGEDDYDSMVSWWNKNQREINSKLIDSD